MSTQFKILTILVFIFIMPSYNLYAHGDLTNRIKLATQEIKRFPDKADLYFQRALLYQQHLEFDKAIIDYKKTKKLGLQDKELYYRIAECYIETKAFKKANKASKRLLKLDTIDVKTRKLHSKVLFHLKDYENAISHYDYFFNNVTDLNPQDVIEYASFILAHEPKNYLKAIAIIEQGELLLGVSPFSLQLKKLDYYKSTNDISSILNQYDYIIKHNYRKEFWYYKKANYLYGIKKHNASKVALELAKESIRNLSLKLKKTKAIEKLTQSIIELESII